MGVKVTAGDTVLDYDITVLNLGVDKNDKQGLTATGTGVQTKTVDLTGLGVSQNTISSTIWVVNKALDYNGNDAKQVVLIPGRPVYVGTQKKGTYAAVTLAEDGKSVTVATTDNKDAKGKLLKGNVTIQAYNANAKVIKKAVKVTAAK